jgi:trans-aconitate methyltransferase
MAEAQTWNPEHYAAHARFVSDLAQPVIELLAPVAGERILDLGCGHGVLMEVIGARGCTVVGVDSSKEMIAACTEKGLDARVVDGESLAFQNEFDAVFSNAALHWMKNPDAVIAGVARALKPKGRFVGEMGGKGNVGAVVAAIETEMKKRGLNAQAANPWYFPDVEEYRAKLERNGFNVREIALITRPTPLPSNMAAWLKGFAGAFLKALPDEEREPFIRDVQDRLKPVLHRDGVWVADYVRLRFAADKIT